MWDLLVKASEVVTGFVSYIGSFVRGAAVQTAIVGSVVLERFAEYVEPGSVQEFYEQRHEEAMEAAAFARLRKDA